MSTARALPPLSAPEPTASPAGAGGSLARRIALVGGLTVALVMTGVGLFNVWQMERQAEADLLHTANAQARSTAQLLDGLEEATRRQAERLHQAFAENFSLRMTLDAEAADLTSGTERLKDNFGAVDRFSASTGGVATIFARKGEDFQRITTSLKNDKGERVLGTMLGLGHPAYKSMMEGGRWSGRAFLFGRHYMSHYQAVKDDQGRVVGILFVGFDMTDMMKTIDNLARATRLLETGGLYLIDPKKKAEDAVFISHPQHANRKVIEAGAGHAESYGLLARAMAAGKGRFEEALALPHGLLAAGDDRWVVAHQADRMGWWVVAEVSNRELRAEHMRAASTLIGSFLLLGLCLAAGLAWMLRAWVSRPLAALGTQLSRVAAGDLTQPLHSSRDDEVGRLTAQAESMRHMLATTIGQVRQASEEIETASNEVAVGNQDLSQRTEQTASNLQMTASSIEQLTGTVRQSADAASQANQLAHSATQVAQRGGEVVSQVVSTMDEINSSSKRIADIIGTIDGIAFQTNILALNAAVEAARAGEQGRGFAVVAGEVRALAQRSAEAAREIKTLIGTSVEKVETGARLVQDAGSTMNEIVSSVQRVGDIIGEITAAAAEQSAGFGQVNGAVNQLDQMTQQNAALVEESAAAAASLKEQAQRLVSAVAVFQVRPGAAGGAVGSAPMARAAADSPMAASVARARSGSGASSSPPAKAPQALARQAVAQARDSSRPGHNAAAGTPSDDWESF
jgi:methyl-accepting chemotaxis protein-2 (aspartate sensor receptor)